MARYLVTFLPGNPISTRTKYIDDAVGPPDADVDWGTDGVSFGSIVWDGTDLWFCVDPTTAAAQYVQINGGGSGGDGSLVEDTSVSGSITIDRDDAATHDLTLTGNVSATLAGAVPGERTDWAIIRRQDGTGGHTWTWVDAIAWVGGIAPVIPSAPDAFDVVGIFTVDDGATYIGFSGTVAEVTQAEFDDHSARHEDGGADEISIAGLSGSPLAVDAHLADASDAHDASAISLLDTGGNTTETDVEGAIAELYGLAGGGSVTGAQLVALGVVGPLLIADEHSTPIVFGDLLLTEDGDDFLYGDLG